MKHDRMFRLFYLLLERKSMTAPELAAHLEVSVRTVYRDVEALSMAGIPICAMAGKGGGISLMPGYTFDKAVFSKEEQNQLFYALQSLQAADPQMGELLSKLGAVFEKTDTAWIEVDFSRWGLRKTDHNKFEQLKRAILERRVLHMVYFGASGEGSERDVKPIRLIFKSKSWYLQAFCMKAEDFRLFKVNRMTEIYLREESFNDDFSALPWMEDAPPPCVEMQPVTLRFQKETAFRLLDEFESEQIVKQEDGSFLVTAAFPMDGWTMSYLLSFGTQMEIVGGPVLRALLAAHAKEIAEHHKT